MLPVHGRVAPPPLPDLIGMPTAQTRSSSDELAGEQPPSRSSLGSGCYLINYTATVDPLVSYDGTLRVDASMQQFVASGDLYQRDTVVPDELGMPIKLAPSPDPAAGIPIFPIVSYRFYLRVKRVVDTDAGFGLVFEVYGFSAAEVPLLDGTTTRWMLESELTALMVPVQAPAGFPLPRQCFSGDVTNQAGTKIGHFSMVLVSRFLRRAVVEIDRVPESELPLDNGAGVTWKTVFDALGWDITLLISDSDVEGPSDGTWNGAEADAAMLARRDKSDFDKEWRYYILAVQLIDYGGLQRGWMFDLPRREGLMVSSHWPIPDKPEWGLVRGMRAGTTVTYLRTAIHETGHAMGLEHNGGGHFFMRPTDGIAAGSTPAVPFPNNMDWTFSHDDEHRLRHWPDLIVRPGGLGFASGKRAPSGQVQSGSHRLEVTPLLTTVPVGAPVRLDVRLINTSDHEATGPQSLSLTSGPVSGQVIDSSGTVRTFSPLVINESTNASQTLQPGEHIDASMTLFGGQEGPLFPAPGSYRIVVEATWSAGDLAFFSRGVTTVMVTAAVDAVHAAAARKVLSTSETLLVLALGGDHLKEGIAAIDTALQNDILRPHFAFVGAKRLATRFRKREPDLIAAANLIDEKTVMSSAELRKAVRMAMDDKGAGGKAIAAKLRAKIATERVDNDISEMLRSL